MGRDEQAMADRPKPARKPSRRPMPEMLRPDAGVLARMDALMPAFPVRRKAMFGTVSWFLESNDQMCVAVWGPDVQVRLGVEGVEAAVASGEARRFEPIAGRPMKEYVLVPSSTLSDAEVRGWVERGIAFTSTVAGKKPGGGRAHVRAVAHPKRARSPS